jgi:putative ABC transport system permease protein
VIRHIVRLLWHRKRHNVLIGLEIFISYLVLFGVMLFAVSYATYYRYPLGYDINRVWRVGIRSDFRNDREDDKAAARQAVQQVLLALRDLPEIEAVAGAFTAPYENASWGSGMKVGGKQYDYGVNEVTDAYRDVIDLKLVAGRWFSKDDDSVSWNPVVMNAMLAREMFGTTNAVGKSFRRDPDPHDKDLSPEDRTRMLREMRVVGVIEDFRQHGELSRPENFMFNRMRLDDPEKGAPRELVLKVRPGTTADFEEKLVKTMQAAAHDWSFDVQETAALRRQNLRNYLVPLAAIGIVAGFLLVMVALGLTGVLWQNITQRTREIGLRRAKGATRINVHTQILAELMVITTGALLIAMALVAQAPLLPWQVPARVIPPPSVMLISMALSAACIYGLTLLCGWYPSRLATSVDPADALRYE